MARIVIAGYLVRYPLGGNIWAHLSYVVGLARLGHEVWFIEEAGWEDSCYDPERGVMTSDATCGVRVLAALMEHFGLARRWAYRDWFGRWHGLAAESVEDLIASADLFLDTGGASYFAQMRHARRRAYVDMDPAFTQFGAFGHGRLHEYDVLFTYGANIGRTTCAVPTLGFDWQPLRPPVLLDVWAAPGASPAGTPWTTITKWTAYEPCEYGGETYGQKDIEFMRFVDLPTRTAHRLEIAVSGPNVPAAQLEANGWRLADPLAVSRDPWRYREYVRASRGEFSVAKNAYVKTRCGWFSDRTASYLASGRPAVVQDTGVSDHLPAGRGFLLFRTVHEAVAALATVEESYEEHCRAAREIAVTYFDSDKLCSEVLNKSGV